MLGSTRVGKALNAFTDLITGAAAMTSDGNTPVQSGMGKYGKGHKYNNRRKSIYGRSTHNGPKIVDTKNPIIEEVRPVVKIPKYGMGNIQSDNNGLITGGKVINIPSGLGKVHTYMGWQLITSKSSDQYKLRDKAGENYNSEGFAVINGRYVIACTSTFGKIGDYIDFYQTDGTVIPTIMGDEKSQGDAGCTKWGHDNGKCIVEFVVDKNGMIADMLTLELKDVILNGIKI